MCKGGNPNTLKLKMKLICGKKLRVCCSAMHTIQFCFGLVHLNEKQPIYIFPGKKLLPLLTFLQWKKPYSKLFSGIKFLFVNRFSNFCGTF